MSERYEVRGSTSEMFTVFDTELQVTLCSGCFHEDANKIATALNAAPQAEKAREIIERAEELVGDLRDWVAQHDANFTAGRIDQLLADIAAYKEG